MKRPIRISHLITSLDANGAQTALRRIIERFPAQFSNGVISLAALRPETDVCFPEHVDVASLDIDPQRPNPGSIFRLLRLLRRQRPDVLQTWLYHADFLGTLASFGFRPPHILWNIRCTDMGPDYKHGMKGFMVRRLAAWSSRPDAIVINSAAGRRDHEALGYKPRKWINIPNGFDLDSLKPLESVRNAARLTLGVQDTELLVGAAGRFHKMKGFDVLLKAASEVTAPNVRFVFFGSGTTDEVHALRTLASDLGIGSRVIWAGHWQDITAALNALDVFVSPSLYGEGFPNVVAEAMACALPSVVTSVGDAPIIVGGLTEVIPPGRADALARSIATVAEMSLAQRRELGEKGRNRIAREFAIEKVAARYVDLYSALADNGLEDPP